MRNPKRSYSHHTADRPKCLQCKRLLRRYRRRGWKGHEDMEWGDYGDGFFCNLRCARRWAVVIMRLIEDGRIKVVVTKKGKR